MARYISQKAIIEIAKNYAKERNYDFFGVASYWAENIGEREFLTATRRDVSRMKKAVKEALEKGAKRISFTMFENNRKITADFQTSEFLYSRQKIAA